MRCRSHCTLIWILIILYDCCICYIRIFRSYGARFSDKDIFFAKYLQDAATATAILLVLMKYVYDIILDNSFPSICYSVHSWYPIVCLLIMDGLFAHYVNDVYLRFRELNKIAIRCSKEIPSVSCIDLATNSNMFVRCNSVPVTKIHFIRYIHHELYVLATKVLAPSNLLITLAYKSIKNIFLLKSNFSLFFFLSRIKSESDLQKCTLHFNFDLKKNNNIHTYKRYIACAGVVRSAHF